MNLPSKVDVSTCDSEPARLRDDALLALTGAGLTRGSRSARRVFILVCLALIALVGLEARSAQAAQTRALLSSFGSFTAPSGIAFDETKDNVLVADGGISETVDIFGPNGELPNGVSGAEISGFRFGTEPSSIAVDSSTTSPSNGAVYVTDVQANAVKKFTLNAGHEYELQEALNAHFGEPLGVAVNAAGDVFVGDYGSSSVIEFGPEGRELQRISTGGTVGPPSALTLDAVGDLYVQGYGGGSVYEYLANSAGEVTPSSSSKQIVNGGATGVAFDLSDETLYVAMGDHIAAYSSAGELEGEFGTGLVATQRLAIDTVTDDLYVVDRGTGEVDIFGPPTGFSTHVGPASNITARKATLNGSVNPGGATVESCIFEYGETTSYGHGAACEGAIPPDAIGHPVSADIASLAPNEAVYHYRLVVQTESGTNQSADMTFKTANVASSAPATAVTVTSATVHGTVRPEGLQFSNCIFEYGPGSGSTFPKSVPCSPAAAEIPADEAVHGVSAVLTGLQGETTYRFRLSVADAEGTSESAVGRFQTVGAPNILEVQALDASETSATLMATIDPRGLETSYYFEWGPTSSYGSRVPASGAVTLSGTAREAVSTMLSGLSSGTTYHYRVVASNREGGTTVGSDHELETVNSCGLPDGRCFELVSPREVGLVANPGQFQGSGDMHFQAATTPGAVAYTVENGLTETTVGGEPLYRGVRGPGGWNSTELSPPVTARSETTNGTALGSVTVALSNDLSCGVVVSPQPLTDDVGTRPVVEGGGTNLYRRSADGAYTAITKLPPENPESTTADFFQEYRMIGMSTDCGKVVFATAHHYPGVAGVGAERLYEWDGGTLHNVGVVPGPAGEIAVQANAEGPNAVSEDGSRVFFSAERQTEENPLEHGARAIYVREDGVRTRDVSQSQGPLPDLGAAYQYASKDGSRVFFTANAGLTRQTSSEGTDLYEYNLKTEALTDLSIDTEVGGAEVGGFIGGSEDGSVIYFAAKGQLVPGKGMTAAENQAAGTYSIYAISGRNIRYVAPVATTDLARVASKDLAENTGRSGWSSRTSPDGRYLTFESTVKVTGYESRGVPEAYLFDDDAGPEATVCVSCRQDGGSAVSRGVQTPLEEIEELNSLHPQQSVVEHEGQPVVFFSSPDKLADGATEDAMNLYEWAHGQVFLLTSEPTGFPIAKRSLNFVGASTDGGDVYFATPESLTWEDGDTRSSVYDARIGGGFPEPPAPPSPCEPNSEGSCQGASSAASGTVSPAASSTFSGAGNLIPAAPGRVVKPKPPTRAQKLAMALKSCRKDKSKPKRLSCEKRARKQFGPKPKAKPKRKTTAKRKRGK